MIVLYRDDVLEQKTLRRGIMVVKMELIVSN